jgi:hypothetical protein
METLTMVNNLTDSENVVNAGILLKGTMLVGVLEQFQGLDVDIEMYGDMEINKIIREVEIRIENCKGVNKLVFTDEWEERFVINVSSIIGYEEDETGNVKVWLTGDRAVTVERL